jgi:hypothetical protein
MQRTSEISVEVAIVGRSLLLLNVEKDWIIVLVLKAVICEPISSIGMLLI